MKIQRKHKADLQNVIYFSQEPEELVVPSEAEALVRQAIAATLQHEEFPAAAELSVTFCDGPYIQSLNATYRQKDSVTDVLSFPIFDQDEEDPLDDAVVPLGDIVINLSRAEEQAAELGHSTEREIVFLTIHSMLHLLGYDHERSLEEEEDMCKRQREILAAHFAQV